MRDVGIAIGFIVFVVVFVVSNGFKSNSVASSDVTVRTADPTVDDDIDRGFLPGYQWVNQSNQKIYGVVSTGDGTADWDQLNGAGGSGTGHIIQDETVDLTPRTNLNFAGAGVACTDDTGTDATNCTIPGGGAQNLAGVLSTGNTSGGADINLSGAGDILIFTRTNTLEFDALTQSGGGGIAQIPNLSGATDQIVLEDTIQALTNKTLDDFSNDIHADKLHVELRNESGGTMNIGDVVFISGYSVGQELALVDFADSSSAATMPAVAMLTDSSLANNTSGQFAISGRVTDFDTSAFSVGDAIWVSTIGTTNNTLTNVKPIGAELIQGVGEILRSHATLGVIELIGTGRIADIPNLADDSIFQGDSTGVPVPTAIPDCDASPISRLQYDTTTNAWSCVSTTIDISDDTNLVAGSGITLTDDTLSVDVVDISSGTNLTVTGGIVLTLDELSAAITTNDIVDDTILEVDLDAVDTPADGEFLTFDSGTGGFEWEAGGGGGADNSFNNWRRLAANDRISTEFGIDDDGTVFTFTADVMYAHAFVVGGTAIAIDGWWTFINTGGGANTDTRFCVYQSSSSLPGALLVDGGTIDSSTTTDKSASYGAVTLAANSLYWFVFWSDGTPQFLLAKHGGVPVFGETTGGSSLVVVTRTLTFTTCPDPFGTPTVAIGPNPLWGGAIIE